MHTSNLYYTEPQVTLAALLLKNIDGKVFFCNSGAEANEAAIKLARKLGKVKHGAHAYEIITAERSFHGRTLAAVTATGQTKYHQGFEPMVEGFHYGRFNDVDSFAALVSEKTCAIMVEPVQGEGGIYPASTDFLKGLRELCDRHQLLLIFDEVQCGIGRTGKLMAYEHYGVEPDVVTLAKALGGGLPIGAMVAIGEAAEGFVPGDHASTFGGNPVSCAAAAAVLQEILENGFLDRVRQLGDYFMSQLEQMAAVIPQILDVRGMGLMIGMDVDCDGNAVARRCQEKGLLINCIGGKILRFLPPLVVEKDHIDAGLTALQEILQKVCQAD
jgi:predicted acetylornithine/succinylornithine family transaminase